MYRPRSGLTFTKAQNPLAKARGFLIAVNLIVEICRLL